MTEDIVFDIDDDKIGRLKADGRYEMKGIHLSQWLYIAEWDWSPQRDCVMVKYNTAGAWVAANSLLTAAYKKAIAKKVIDE